MSKKAAVFSPKSRINHGTFGTGTILDVNERHTTILFDENGERKFVTDMVVLEASDTPAPKRPIRRKKTTTVAKRTTKATKKTAKVTKKTSKVTKKK